MNTLRECAEAAVKASGADGWQITGGTAHAWAVTLYFNRDGEVKRNAGNHDGADGGRSALVASEDPRLTRARGETELAPPRRSWKRLAAETPSGGVWRVSEIDDEDKFPVTVIEGHIDLAEIEREAYERGRQAIIDITMPLLKAETLAIDGVSPVVVDGFIDDRFEVKPWVVGGLLAVFKKNCGKDRPCRVHLYPGIGPDGKRAGGRE